MGSNLSQKLLLLLKYDLKIASETDLDRLLVLLTEAARQVLEADRCTVFLVDRRTGQLWSKLAQGMETKTILLRKGQGLAGQAFLTCKTINVRDVYADSRFSRHVDVQTGYHTKTALMMPMWDSKNQNVLGVFEVLNKRRGWFTQEDERLLTILSNHASVAVENSQLYDDLKQAQQETIFRLALMAEHRDQHDTAAHLKRVSVYTCLVAETMGMEPEEVEMIRLASTLHDIGKVATPDAILLKSEKLTSTELGAIEYRLAWWSEKLKLVDAPAERLKEISRFAEEIRQANRPSSIEMPEPLMAQIRHIGSQRFMDRDGKVKPLLTVDEVKKLTIMRGNLTESEWEEICKHTIYGAKILAQADSQLMRMAERIALTHHEKYDGSGYPKGLKGSHIPMEGRIVGLVDVFDALSSRRVYKQRWSFEDVIAHLKRESGKHFDPKIVKVFLKAFPGIRQAMKDLSG